MTKRLYWSRKTRIKIATGAINASTLKPSKPVQEHQNKPYAGALPVPPPPHTRPPAVPPWPSQRSARTSTLGPAGPVRHIDPATIGEADV
jgi:hypothetical protein